MAFAGSILDYVTSDRRTVLPAFATIKPHEWATQQYQLRYRQVPPEIRTGSEPSARVYAKLIAEHNTIRTWYTQDGVMSPLLIGQSTARNQKPALGDGITFDFDADLQIDQRVIQFKLHLLAVTEMIKALPDRSASTLAPLAKVIKAAYQARAEAHSWRNIHNGLSGAELASRWVAHRTYVYLLSIGAEADWAWGTSGAASVLGPVDWIGGGRDVVSGA